MIGRNGMAGLFNVNRSVTGLGSGVRQFRLPTLNPFPKFEQCVSPPAAGGTVVAGSLPEMVSDLIDESAVYAVENVRRERAGRLGLGGRVWDAGLRESRP